MSFIKKTKDVMAWKGLKSLEFRALWWLWRAFWVVLFVLYLILDVPPAIVWVKIKYIRHQDFTGFEQVMAKAASSSDFSALEDWVQYRSLKDSKPILDLLTPQAHHLPSLLLLNLAGRAAYLGDDDARKFWMIYARYRLRYDALRCGASNATKVSDALLGAMTLYRPDLLANISEDALPGYVRRVLDYDGLHPADNDPTNICKKINMIAGYSFIMTPEKDWPQVRFNLRYATDISLRDAEKAKKAPVKPAPGH